MKSFWQTLLSFSNYNFLHLMFWLDNDKKSTSLQEYKNLDFS